MCHFDRREKSYVFNVLLQKDFSLAQTGVFLSGEFSKLCRARAGA